MVNRREIDEGARHGPQRSLASFGQAVTPSDIGLRAKSKFMVNRIQTKWSG